MRLAAGGARGKAAGRELGHLTYCTNIHAGEPLADVMASLARHLPAIKAEVAPDHALGVGLRLGHAAAEGLRDRAALEALKGFLADNGYYVFTLNGFPYGAFHGRTVKEDAYKPDWSDPHRLRYTNLLADILSELLPPGQVGSVSSVPCTFKPWAEGRLEAITENLLRHAAHLVGIAARTGQAIALALEPEPCCYLETIEETVAFFGERLYSRSAVARLAALTGLNLSQAESALRRHLGVCYDVCHAAVEFEDPKASLARLRASGIPVGKLQLSSALRLAQVSAASMQHLAAFNEPVYLHQVVQNLRGTLRRFADLPEALAQAKGAAGAEWRVHFHVPVILERMEHFDSTQAFLREVLALHRADPVSAHLEVETYTWDVLPEEYRRSDLSAAIARELNWVKAELLQ
jgi:sugar phosphate isomerase/epimerase